MTGLCDGRLISIDLTYSVVRVCVLMIISDLECPLSPVQQGKWLQALYRLEQQIVIYSKV